VTVVTHGCRSNLAERDALALLAPSGATVINSCAVTAAAVRDARAAAVRALRGGGPAGGVVLTGCAATVAPERFADLPVQIIANADKLRPAAWGRPGPAPVAATRQSRGFVAVQDGCDHHCTFCVTRIARGPSRSLDRATVVEAVARLAAAGVAEVVLTGIDLGSWGRDCDGGPGLGALVQAILGAVPRLPRLRLSSLDVGDVDPALIEALAEPRLMPHIHLAIQSGDDLVLARMRRRHRRADIFALVERLRAVRADLALGADFIAGFPTETDGAHRRSLDLIDACGLVHGHVFAFSPRPGTPAARMPQIPAEVARARAAALRSAVAAAHARFLDSALGGTIETLSEGARGLGPHYQMVRYRHPHPRGALVAVAPRAVEDRMLVE
jgi:threonylcarbamoyladenosine tRNA methylthiotransferase MtaB